MTVEAPTMTAGPAPWTPSSWRSRPTSQRPEWVDHAALGEAIGWLATQPELVAAQEVQSLRTSLARSVADAGFVIQLGDCAETFRRPTASAVAARLRQFDQAAALLEAALGDTAVVAVGRIAGQYAKPRSSPVESSNGRELPVFRGYLVNSPRPHPIGRLADPRRLVRGRRHAGAVVTELHRSSATTRPRGAKGDRPPLWTSHEALVLDYEEPQLRQVDGRWVLTSTHLPWIGVRTSQLDGAHVELLRGVANPVGLKVAASSTDEAVLDLCRRLDPDREPGRLILISRLGAARVRDRLPRLVRAVREAGHPVIWMCDPMHGNTYLTAGGRKSRRLEDVAAEIEGFFDAVLEAGGWPGGLHLEATPADVTECVGGASGLGEADLHRRYETACDPRLNGEQTTEIVRFAAGLCRRAARSGGRRP